LIDSVDFDDDLSSIDIGGSSSGVGTGGAVTKVSAAKLANKSGIPVLLTSADLVAEALSGAPIGTWFESKVGS
jgi:glutamate 5-kinase